MTDTIRSGVWRCTSGFSLSASRRRVRNGAAIPRDHPYSVMDGHEQSFVEVDHAEELRGPFKVAGSRTHPAQPPTVEAAVQIPGEARSVTMPEHSCDQCDQCDQCDRTFTTAVALGRHRKVHDTPIEG